MAIAFRLGQLTALVVGAAAVGLLSTKWQPSWGGLLVIAAALVLSLPLIWRATTGKLDVFEPLPLFSAIYGVMFLVRPAAMLNDDVTFYELAGVTVDIGDTFQKVQVIALVGAIAFIVGYLSPYGAVFAARLRAPRAPDPRGMLRLGLAVGVVGVVAAIAFARLQGGFDTLLEGRSESYYTSLSATSKYLYYLPTLLISAALLSFAAWRGTHNPWFGWTAVGMVAVLLAVRGSVGSRLALVPLAGGLFFFLYLQRGTRPQWSTVGIVLIAALSTSAFIGEVRDANARQESGVVGIAGAFWSTPTSVFEPLTTGQDAAAAPAFAAALTVSSTIERQLGTATVGDLALRVVPRALWPNKPLPVREEVVTTIYGQNRYANPEFSPLFAFYMDGKLLGVLIGLGLYGLLARTAWEYTRLHSGSSAVLLAYAVLLPSMAMFLRDQPTDALARTVFYAGPIIAAIWWLPRPWVHRKPAKR